MNAQLLPCPFCGSAAVACEHEDMHKPAGMGIYQNIVCSNVGCPASELVITTDTAEQSAAQWNTRAALAAPKEAGAPVLIGWRSADYTMETADKSVAQNWAANISVLPIFAGDPNTKLANPPGGQQQEGEITTLPTAVVASPATQSPRWFFTAHWDGEFYVTETPMLPDVPAASPPPEAAAAVGEDDGAVGYATDEGVTWYSDHFCTKSRKPKAGTVLYTHASPTGPQPLASPAGVDDSKRLDAVLQESWKLDPFDMPTGAGDADVGWRVVQYHGGDPRERVVAEVYSDDPRAAIDAALAARDGGAKA